MYFLLKMGIFQPTMLVYQRVHKKQRCIFPNTPLRPPTPILSSFDDGLAPPSTAEVLSDYGYDTAAFGKWHNTPINDLFKSGPFDQYPTGAFGHCDWRLLVGWLWVGCCGGQIQFVCCWCEAWKVTVVAIPGEFCDDDDDLCFLRGDEMIFVFLTNLSV